LGSTSTDKEIPLEKRRPRGDQYRFGSLKKAKGRSSRQGKKNVVPNLHRITPQPPRVKTLMLDQLGTA